MLNHILEKILADGTPADIDQLLEIEPNYSTDQLCDAADAVRRRWSGNRVHTCSIVNARSGRCSEDCKWCAQSARHNTGIREYEYIPRREMMDAFHANRDNGVRCFSLVTSGRRIPPAQIDYFCRLYREASAEGGISLCASMGLLDREQLQKLWDAGVRKYHCNLETSRAFFPRLCSTHTTDDKLRTIEIAREIGFKICSGGIIGMGESLRDRLELAAEARDAGADSIPLNILQPIKGTPLEGIEQIGEDEIARSAALMRLVAPKCTIHFAGGRARLSRPTMERMMRGGVNGALVGDMLTTIGSRLDDDRRLFAATGYTDEEQ
ncbi:MAG: biotin synthase BioB [Clostridium sp.]|nr:biotin synthase BioB [Clostridium sp.]